MLYKYKLKGMAMAMKETCQLSIQCYKFEFDERKKWAWRWLYRGTRGNKLVDITGSTKSSSLDPKRTETLSHLSVLPLMLLISISLCKSF